MQMSRTTRESLSVLAVSGTVDHAADGPDLRAGLLAVVDGADGDVALDAREVVAFDDAALVALTAARSRAKYLGRRIVVVDGAGGQVATALRRTGLLYRFPVYLDVDAAGRGLGADRASAARRVVRRIEEEGARRPG